MCTVRSPSPGEAFDIQIKLHGHEGNRLILGQFAARHLPTLSDNELDMFEALLDAGDPRILAWVQGDEQVPEAFQGTVIDLIKNFEVQ